MITASLAVMIALLGSSNLDEGKSKTIKLSHIPAEKVAQLMKEGRVPVPDKVAFRSIDQANVRLSGAEDDILKVEDAIKAVDKTPRQVILKFVFGEEGVPPKPIVFIGPVPRALEYQSISLRYDTVVRGVKCPVIINCYAFPNPDSSSSIRADIQVGGHKLVSYLDKEDLITFGGKDYPKGFRITNRNKLKREVEAVRPFGQVSGLTIGFWPTLIESDDSATE